MTSFCPRPHEPCRWPPHLTTRSAAPHRPLRALRLCLPCCCPNLRLRELICAYHTQHTALAAPVLNCSAAALTGHSPRADDGVCRVAGRGVTFCFSVRNVLNDVVQRPEVHIRATTAAHPQRVLEALLKNLDTIDSGTSNGCSSSWPSCVLLHSVLCRVGAKA